MKKDKSLILTPVLRQYINMSQEEVDALKGVRRTQYRYRLKTRLEIAFSEIREIIALRPKDVEIDEVLLVLQERLRHAFPNDEVAIRIETKRKRRD